MSNGNGNGGGALVTIRDLLERKKGDFAKALPSHLGVDRLLRVAMTCISSTPKLQECSASSLLGSILKCAELGLEPGGALGHAYLVPFKGVCTLIIGYRGLIELARRSGDLSQIEAHVVYSNDTFELEYGLNSKLRHVPMLSGDRGRALAVYCVARLRDGGTHVEVMTAQEIDAIQARSLSGSSGPWKTDWSEMARKTVVRRAAKYLPLSSERMAAALEADGEDYVEGSAVNHTDAQLPEGAAAVPETKTAGLKKKLLPSKIHIEDIPGEPPADVALPTPSGQTAAEAEVPF